MGGLLVNPTALVPVTQPGDLRQDRVGQLVKRVLDGKTSEETRRAYSHALRCSSHFAAGKRIRRSQPSWSRATGSRWSAKESRPQR
jgi:hypothetical protein